ncbi:alanine dehydrogenase [Pseudonocardia alni]|jgi:alanine dehydrogenase|uniref:alanine dehydrogenase n=1 Tax=Pseudonocardia alni TaxID=33907 RepID=UPI0006CB6057|nr:MULTISPECIES: alanine dehydrogenase [Pseudonocardia]ALE78947.1 alanine dehydrogenase [Pseudonocardia sp. AL041005-10]
MRVAVPKETKDNEFRVALTPAGVHELVGRGHEVVVEHDAGAGSAISDADFKEAGAQIASDAAEVWGSAELLLKVKEPISSEYGHLRPDLTLFTYLHLAASRACTDALLSAGTTSIAYETVTDSRGRLPLLAPMSEVAGRLAPQAGGYHLMRSAGGRGMLLGGVPGAPGADVVVLGAGVAGANAIAIAAGMRAKLTVLDVDVDKLRVIDEQYAGAVRTQYSTALSVREAVTGADLVIGAVLLPGAKAPTLVSNELVSRMRPGAVLVDIAIDQGGCFEDSRPTTHADPTYRVHDTVFYCVANMPGAVPHTSTRALTNATLPHVLRLADQGWRAATEADPHLAAGLSTHHGVLLSEEVAQAHGLERGTV